MGGSGYDSEKIAAQLAFRLQTVYKDYEITTFPNGANYGIKIDFGPSVMQRLIGKN